MSQKNPGDMNIRDFVSRLSSGHQGDGIFLPEENLCLTG